MNNLENQPNTTDTTADDESIREEEGHRSRSTRREGYSNVRRRTLLKAIGVGSVLPAAASGQAAATTDPWTIVALPDTQNYARSSTLVTYAQDQVDWIVDNANSENIAFVTHEGDIVDEGHDRTEWERMDDVMSTLDGTVPYGTLPGNHDWFVQNDRSSSIEYYREFFGEARYQGRSWYGGSAPNDLNHYQLFSAGGYDFLHINLEWEAPGDASDPETPLGWAQSVLDQYPDRPTIITTHSYVWDGDPPGRTTFVEETNGDGSSGEEIWQEIIEPNPQVFMVLNGHFFRDSDSDRGEYHQVSTNSADLSVYEMLACYQHYSNGGNGWMRLIRFVPDGGSGDLDRIEVRTYSPSLDEYQTDSNSRFNFDLSFADRFEPDDGDTAVAVSTDTATDVGATTATVNGTLDDLGGASSADVSFEYRERGTSSWSTTDVQTLSSTGSFSESVSELSSETEYEFRAVAEAGDGDTDTGGIVTFATSTADTPPAVDSYTVSERGKPNPHAQITADWVVSDVDGDLDSVVVEVFDSGGTLVGSARTNVSDSSESGTDEIKIKHVENQTFDVTLTVTDASGSTASRTETVTTSRERDRGRRPAKGRGNPKR